MNRFYTLILTLLFASTLLAQPVMIGGLNRINDANGVLVQGSAAESSQQDKMDFGLRYLLNNQRVLTEIAEAGKTIDFTIESSGRIFVPLFIHATDLSRAESAVLNIGGMVSTKIGDIMVARVPLDLLTTLEKEYSVIRMEASYVRQPVLNVSHKEIKADQVHSGVGLPSGYKGSGVVVGVLDSGIDWKHVDFKGSDNTTRIRYLWDMSGTTNPPSGYSYGREYTKSQIDAGQCFQIDGDGGGGHGTHVAGTAAGSGKANTSYLGVAPEADIIFVKGMRSHTSSGGFADADVVDGCSYIFNKAAQMGKSAVINLSLGGHFGPHDGTSLYEQSLSNLTGNGKIIVAAAGNEGNDQIHLSYATSGSNFATSKRTFWVIPQGNTTGLIDAWYQPGNISFGLAAYDNSLNLIGYTNPISAGQQIQDVAFTVGGTTYGWVTIDATAQANPNGARRVIVYLDSHSGQVNISNVYWALYTIGTGTFDAWIARGGYFTTDSNPGLGIVPGDNNKSIGMPATGNSIIAVGSYVTKTQWVDIDGNTWNQGGNPTINSISGFSSLGPSRDGRVKPDITAPGEVILAALSSDLTIGNGVQRQEILQGGKHKKMQGTSMAAPHVTGVVALMLNRNSSLNYTQAVSTLKSTARADAFTGQVPNNTYGSGKVNALAAVQSTSGGGGGIATIFENKFDADPFPGNGWTHTITNQFYTWQRGNPQNNNFNTVDPTSVTSAICPWIAQNQDEWIISPAFSLGAGQATLSFYAGYNPQWISGATLKVHISTNGGANWTLLWELPAGNPGWVWKPYTLDLTSYGGGSNLKIGYQYIGNDGDLIGIDNVKLQGYLPNSVINQGASDVPTEFQLHQNYPNPFNPTTTIRFAVPQQSGVSLMVYDALGQQVQELVNEDMAPGTYSVDFDGAGLSSGLYFTVLRAGSVTLTRKMMLVK